MQSNKFLILKVNGTCCLLWKHSTQCRIMANNVFNICDCMTFACCASTYIIATIHKHMHAHMNSYTHPNGKLISLLLCLLIVWFFRMSFFGRIGIAFFSIYGRLLSSYAYVYLKYYCATEIASGNQSRRLSLQIVQMSLIFCSNAEYEEKVLSPFHFNSRDYWNWFKLPKREKWDFRHDKLGKSIPKYQHCLH